MRSGPQGAQSCHNPAHATRRPPRHIVGAGGIGQMLYESIRSFQYAETAAQVIIVVVTVVGILPLGFYCRGPREAL
jgi:hypothetical protein